MCTGSDMVRLGCVSCATEQRLKRPSASRPCLWAPYHHHRLAISGEVLGVVAALDLP